MEPTLVKLEIIDQPETPRHPKQPPPTKMTSPKEYNVRGFKVTVAGKPAFEAVGFTRFVRLDGKAIAAFLKELADSGLMDKLAATLDAPQQVWVCLSDNEGRSDADCRCTVSVVKSGRHDFSRFAEGELFTLRVPESLWADFELGRGQTSTDLHRAGVYNLVGEIGYRFNGAVGLHFDNEHEEADKTMHFLLPVVEAGTETPETISPSARGPLSTN